MFSGVDIPVVGTAGVIHGPRGLVTNVRYKTHDDGRISFHKAGWQEFIKGKRELRVDTFVGDQVALMSAFAEMGLKLRVDMPQQSLDIASIFFHQSTTATEAKENIKALNEQRERNTKALQENMKLNKKEVKHFNPVDAFPGDAIIFMRVLNLLRGLSASLNVRIVYLDIMRPFAESNLLGSMTRSPSTNSEWIYDSPVNSEVESKLRNLLIEMGSDKFLILQGDKEDKKQRSSSQDRYRLG
ncbi:hypothetical protein ZWY2020_052261 [Hordeum vulgare]|nr:hypothetical protein ZWY2020_052261 [Hordeum vulgare]